MEKLLQETFADLRLTARQQSVFEEVYVERLCLLREQKRVEVHIVSEHIIPYREIALLEYALNQLFDKAGFTVQVTDRFRLSEQYTPENFWQEYQDSILMILKESNVLEFNMFYSGECHLEGETLYLCCDDDILFRARETEVIKKVQDLFSRKAGFSITLKISYREPQIQEEEEISYRDVIQHKNQVQSVEAFGTEKAQGSERGSGTKNMGAQGKSPDRKHLQRLSSRPLRNRLWRKRTIPRRRKPEERKRRFEAILTAEKVEEVRFMAMWTKNVSMDVTVMAI